MTISMLWINLANVVVIAALSARVIFLHRKYKRLEIDIAVVKTGNAALRHSLTEYQQGTRRQNMGTDEY